VIKNTSKLRRYDKKAMSKVMKMSPEMIEEISRKGRRSTRTSVTPSFKVVFCTTIAALDNEASIDEKEAHRKQSAKILKEMFAPNFTRAVLELVTSDEAREQLADTLQNKAPCFTDEFETAAVECMAAMVRGQVLDPSRFHSLPEIDPNTRRAASAMIELGFAKIIGGNVLKDSVKASHEP
ncbi:hypothetical protein Pmar_PMAR015425, partial [Perkinsus marinus ATCC 50983]